MDVPAKLDIDEIVLTIGMTRFNHWLRFRRFLLGLLRGLLEEALVVTLAVSAS